MSDERKKPADYEEPDDRRFEEFLHSLPESWRQHIRDKRALLNPDESLSFVLQLRLLLGEALNGILDVIFGSKIVPVPKHLNDLVDVSNRIVSFLDGGVHFGTGILVGPAHVLTAAHLFFDTTSGKVNRPLDHIEAEVHTTLLGSSIIEGDPVRSPLKQPEWLIDPELDGDQAKREVNNLDFAIVQLRDALGDSPVGIGKPRGFIEIPTADTAPILAPGTMLSTFQFLDRKSLLTSSGFVRDVTDDRMRFLHTASTADGGSGAAILNDDLELMGLHLAGAASGEFPKSNRGLPIRRVAEKIDEVIDGKTIRSKIH